MQKGKLLHGLSLLPQSQEVFLIIIYFLVCNSEKNCSQTNARVTGLYSSVFQFAP